MAKIVRYDLNHYFQEMLIDLDIGDRLPNEINVICNDSVIKFRPKEKNLVCFGWKCGDNDINYVLLNKNDADELATIFHNNGIWFYWGQSEPKN